MYLKRNDAEVGYWRKANAIHNWFSSQAENGCLENCERMIISREILEDLLELCNKTLKILDNGKLISKEEQGFVIKLYDEETANAVSEILPTASGFFWGSVIIGEWYREDIEITIEICQEVLNTTDWEKDIVEYYAWW